LLPYSNFCENNFAACKGGNSGDKLAKLITASACEIDQDAAHQLRADGEEVGPVLPLDSPDLD